MIKSALLAGGLLLAATSFGMAQSATTASPNQAGASRSMMQNSGPAKRSAAPAGKAERSAKSKECSAQADQQGLHGKARKSFRSRCMRGA